MPPGAWVPPSGALQQCLSVCSLESWDGRSMLPATPLPLLTYSSHTGPSQDAVCGGRSHPGTLTQPLRHPLTTEQSCQVSGNLYAMSILELGLVTCVLQARVSSGGAGCSSVIIARGAQPCLLNRTGRGCKQKRLCYLSEIRVGSRLCLLCFLHCCFSKQKCFQMEGSRSVGSRDQRGKKGRWLRAV